VINFELSGDEQSLTAGAGTLKAEAAPASVPALTSADSRLVGLVRDHYAFVWRVLRRFGLSPSDADDAAQRVFLVISRRLPEVVPSKDRAFLFRTCMYVASKVRRADKRRAEDVRADCEEEADPAPGAEHLLERRRARELLDRVLSEMPDDLKAVIVLFEIEGLTMSEISATLELPPGTVASRLRRARAELETRVTDALTLPRAGEAP
jgi:RNA polymerase sigma-70 factor (ECF subfamily)